VSIFADYLTLDALLMTIPRLAVIAITTASTTDLCRNSIPPLSDPSTSAFPNNLRPTLNLQLESLTLSKSRDILSPQQTLVASKYLADWAWRSLPQSWSTRGCVRILALFQLTFCLYTLLVAVLQFLSVLYIGRFVDALKKREWGLEDARHSDRGGYHVNEVNGYDSGYKRGA
jgi:hypothetical protein